MEDGGEREGAAGVEEGPTEREQQEWRTGVKEREQQEWRRGRQRGSSRSGGGADS